MTAAVLDTNVVVPLLHAGSPAHGLVLGAVRAAIARDERLALLPQVIFESWVAATRPITGNGLGWTPVVAHAAIARLRDEIDMLADPPSLTDTWLRLVVERGIAGKRAHDARIAVAASMHGFDRVITFNDGDFTGFDQVSAVAPRGEAGRLGVRVGSEPLFGRAVVVLAVWSPKRRIASARSLAVAWM